MTRHFAQQPALADAGLALDQHGVAGSGRESIDESGEKSQFLASADEGHGLGRGAEGRLGRGMVCCRWRRRALARAGRHGIEPQTARAMHCTCRIEENGSLRLGDGQRCGEPFSEPPGRTPLVGLDLADREDRTGDTLGKRLLRQIQGLAAPPQPVAERMRPVLQLV
ncbi:MAG: hypothetical protein V4540_02635 [Pseudomonadota bacterium]